MSKIEKAIQNVMINNAMMDKHPRIIMNGAGMFICGSEIMYPIDGIPARFFSRVRIRK